MTGNCEKCGGLIAEPNKAYGYSGRFCHCMWYAPNQFPLPHGASPLRPLTEDDVRRIVREAIDAEVELLFNVGTTHQRATSIRKPPHE